MIREYSTPFGLESFVQEKLINKENKSGSTIVLKSETFLELGSPKSGSCSMSVYTNNPDKITGGRITIIGPDVMDSDKGELPFAQIIMVGGKEFSQEDYYKLLKINLTNLFNGYMVKSIQGSIWSRISHDAVRNGFHFKILGEIIVKKIKSDFPRAETVEIIFITSSKEDIMKLSSISSFVNEDIKAIKDEIWKDRGVNLFECRPDGHCNSCKDKNLCDEVKKIGVAHNKIQEPR